MKTQINKQNDHYMGTPESIRTTSKSLAVGRRVATTIGMKQSLHTSNTSNVVATPKSIALTKATSPKSTPLSMFLSGKISNSELISQQNFHHSEKLKTMVKAAKRVSLNSEVLPTREQGRSQGLRSTIILGYQQTRQKQVISKNKALLRWKLLAQVVNSNIALRKSLVEEQKRNVKFIASLDDFQAKDYDNPRLNLRKHKLKQLLLFQEKKINSTTSQRVSPRHYHYMLSEQFRLNSDDFLSLTQQIVSPEIRKSMIRSDPFYDNVLQMYLNKKTLFELYLQEKKQRSIIKWKPNMSQSNSCHIGLNLLQPMMRRQNPLEQLQQAKGFEKQLIRNINDIEVIGSQESSPLKQLQPSKGPQQNKRRKSSVVKHNRIKSQQIAMTTGDSLDENQDNISNASVTEAALQQLYSGSNYLQNKIKQNKHLSIQKRVRDVLKLQELKVQTMEANNQKLMKQNIQLK